MHSLPWLWLGVCVNLVSSLEENALCFLLLCGLGEVAWLVMGAVGFAGDLSLGALQHRNVHLLAPLELLQTR